MSVRLRWFRLSSPCRMAVRCRSVVQQQSINNAMTYVSRCLIEEQRYNIFRNWPMITWKNVMKATGNTH